MSESEELSLLLVELDWLEEAEFVGLFFGNRVQPSGSVISDLWH